MDDTLMQQHIAYMTRARRAGKPTWWYRTPCCQLALDTIIPATAGETWDTLTTCPGCGAMFMKIATHHGVRVAMPDTAKED